MLRITVWIVRFKEKLKKRLMNHNEKVDVSRLITPSDVQSAKRLWIIEVQREIVESKILMF